MSSQDRLENVLRDFHVMISKSEVCDADRIIVSKNAMFDLIDRLNACIYEIMDEYEMTQQSRDRALREHKKQGDKIIWDASRQAEDIYAASVMYTQEALGRLNRIVEDANVTISHLYREFGDSMKQQQDTIRENELELKSQLQLLSDTEKYMRLIAERNREIEREEAEKQGRKLVHSSEKTNVIKPEIKINEEYFRKAGIPLDDYVEKKPEKEEKVLPLEDEGIIEDSYKKVDAADTGKGKKHTDKAGTGNAGEKRDAAAVNITPEYARTESNTAKNTGNITAEYAGTGNITPGYAGTGNSISDITSGYAGTGNSITDYGGPGKSSSNYDGPGKSNSNYGGSGNNSLDYTRPGNDSPDYTGPENRATDYGGSGNNTTDYGVSANITSDYDESGNNSPDYGGQGNGNPDYGGPGNRNPDYGGPGNRISDYTGPGNRNLDYAGPGNSASDYGVSGNINSDYAVSGKASEYSGPDMEVLDFDESEDAEIEFAGTKAAVQETAKDDEGREYIGQEYMVQGQSGQMADSRDYMGQKMSWQDDPAPKEEGKKDSELSFFDRLMGKKKN